MSNINYPKPNDEDYIDLINNQEAKIEAAKVIMEIYAALEKNLPEGDVSRKCIRAAIHGAAEHVFHEHDDLDYLNYERDKFKIQEWVNDFIDILM